MSPRGKIRPLLASLRIANVPSVVSNVWAGTALGVFAWGWDGGDVWIRTGSLGLAAVLLYLSGNLFNDWKDREWDAENRPERALPRGLFRPEWYLHAGLACAFAGAVLAFTVSPWSGLAALAILSSISTYTHWHKISGWSVIPMGLCRALLPVMGLFAVAPSAHAGTVPAATLVGTHAAALFFYICGLSISARGEARATAETPPPMAGRCLLGLSGLIAAACWLASMPALAWLGLVPFVAWTALALTLYRRPVSAHVSALLAGIPLLDAVALLPLTVRTSGGNVFAHPFPAACVAVPALAFYLGRRLQGLAPAT